MESQKWASYKRLLNMTRFEKEPNRMSRNEKYFWNKNLNDLVKHQINIAKERITELEHRFD